jgi:hypothetical protein
VVPCDVGIEALHRHLAGAKVEEVSHAGFAYSKRRRVGRVDRIVGKEVVRLTGTVTVSSMKTAPSVRRVVVDPGTTYW